MFRCAVVRHATVTELGQSTLSHSAVFGEQGELDLSWGMATDTGLRRAGNEDSLVALPPVFAVADGMGGHAAGEVASRAVVTRLAELAGNELTTVAALDVALQQANSDIVDSADDAQLGAGTTVTGVALAMHKNTPCWAVFNVGDSRVYLLEDGALGQVTTDHSLVQEMVDAGMLRASEAENHPDSNIITRAVGFNTNPLADFWLLPLQSGARFLVCSDGLTKELSDSEIAGHLSAGHPAQQTADALTQAALDVGGRDNVTVIVLDVGDVCV